MKIGRFISPGSLPRRMTSAQWETTHGHQVRDQQRQSGEISVPPQGCERSGRSTPVNTAVPVDTSHAMSVAQRSKDSSALASAWGVVDEVHLATRAAGLSCPRWCSSCDRVRTPGRSPRRPRARHRGCSARSLRLTHIANSSRPSSSSTLNQIGRSPPSSRCSHHRCGSPQWSHPRPGVPHAADRHRRPRWGGADPRR